MRKIIGTILASLAILALIVMCIFFGGQSLSGLQLGTLSILLTVTFCSIAYCFITGELTPLLPDGQALEPAPHCLRLDHRRPGRA